MSSSFVEYRGRGFWSFDPYLEHLLSLLAEAARDVPKENWLSEAREHWLDQANGAFAGWIHPKLDEYATSDARRVALISLVSAVISRCGVTREVKETAELLRYLLEGQLATDASSPLDYMVEGPQPYKWR